MTSPHTSIDIDSPEIEALLEACISNHAGVHKAQLLERPPSDSTADANAELISQLLGPVSGAANGSPKDTIISAIVSLRSTKMPACLLGLLRGSSGIGQALATQANHSRVGEFRQSLHALDNGTTLPQQALVRLGADEQPASESDNDPLLRTLGQSTSARHFAEFGDDESLGRLLAELEDVVISNVLIETHSIQCHAREISFFPQTILALYADTSIPYESVDQITRTLSDDILRQQINCVLQAGIETDTSLPESAQDWQRTLDALERADKNQLLPLLEIGGFANHSLGDNGSMEDGEMILRCQECIYYLPKRKWCDLPALPLPVEPDWYCKLWKL